MKTLTKEEFDNLVLCVITEKEKMMYESMDNASKNIKSEIDDDLEPLSVGELEYIQAYSRHMGFMEAQALLIKIRNAIYNE